jgi:hypothetical protein
MLQSLINEINMTWEEKLRASEAVVAEHRKVRAGIHANIPHPFVHVFNGFPSFILASHVFAWFHHLLPNHSFSRNRT